MAGWIERSVEKKKRYVICVNEIEGWKTRGPWKKLGKRGRNLHSWSKNGR